MKLRESAEGKIEAWSSRRRKWIPLTHDDVLNVDMKYKIKGMNIPNSIMMGLDNVVCGFRWFSTSGVIVFGVETDASKEELGKSLGMINFSKTDLYYKEYDEFKKNGEIFLEDRKYSFIYRLPFLHGNQRQYGIEPRNLRLKEDSCSITQYFDFTNLEDFRKYLKLLSRYCRLHEEKVLRNVRYKYGKKNQKISSSKHRRSWKRIMALFNRISTRIRELKEHFPNDGIVIMVVPNTYRSWRSE